MFLLLNKDTKKTINLKEKLLRKHALTNCQQGCATVAKTFFMMTLCNERKQQVQMKLAFILIIRPIFVLYLSYICPFFNRTTNGQQTDNDRRGYGASADNQRYRKSTDGGFLKMAVGAGSWREIWFEQRWLKKF